VTDGETPGIYLLGPAATPVLVHAYLNENYALADVAEILQYGKVGENAGGAPMLTLTRREMADVANMINASSFDYDDGFVEMCLDMARHATDAPGAEVVFIEKA
jgi:hypothetical protein